MKRSVVKLDFAKVILLWLILIVLLSLWYEYNNHWILVLCPFILILLYFSSKLVFILALFSSFISFINFNNIKPNIPNDNNFKVTEIKNSYYIISNQEGNYLFKSDYQYQHNDHIKLTYRLNKIYQPNNYYDFDFKNYLKIKNVFYELKASKEELMKKEFSLKNLFYSSSDFIKNETVKNYYESLILGKTNKDDSQFYSEIGILHLFVISGFHFNLIYLGIKKLKFNNLFNLIFLPLYLYCLSFSISATKAFLLILITMICEYKNFKIKGELKIMLVATLLLIINPLNIIYISFYLTILMSLIIVTISKFKINNFNKFIVMYTMSLPIINLINNETNLLSPIFLLLLTPLVIVLIPLSLFGLLNSNLADSLASPINNFIHKIGDYKLLIQFETIPIILTVVLIGFIFVIWKYKQTLIVLFIIPISLMSYQSRLTLLNNYEIHFINVGNADATLIRTPNSNFLIDAGISYETEHNPITTYLKKLNIKNIETVFISHSDNDHDGALDDIANNINVNNVVRNKFSQLHYQDISFTQHNRYQWNSINDNSQVITFSIFDNNFLFTGDISKEVEQKIFPTLKYKDYLAVKIAHHGSNTSTDKQAYNNIRFNNAIIHTGLNNYNHPHPETLDVLKYKNIYTTKNNGTIKISISKTNHSINTLR